MTTNEFKYEGKSYGFKYTLEKYNSDDKKGIWGNKEVLLEQNTLDGFLEEILKDTTSVYRIIYPCTIGSPNFDNYTGRWAFNIGNFNHELKENNKNREIVGELNTIIEGFENIKRISNNIK
jgi:hypothetical protein